MVLDLSLIGPDSDKKIITESQEKRFKDVNIIKECEELYIAWKKARGNLDTFNMIRGQIQKKITERKKANKADACEDLIKEKLENDNNTIEAEKKIVELEDELNKKYSKIGNIVHESVPISDDEANNRVEKTWGTPNIITIDGKPGTAHHHEILHWIGGFDPKRGSNIAGHRGYFLKGYGLLLNQALISHGLKFLIDHKYTPIQPPYFMKHKLMNQTCQLSDFDENLYK
jgi:seryl-tRNA synthetase